MMGLSLTMTVARCANQWLYNHLRAHAAVKLRKLCNHHFYFLDATGEQHICFQAYVMTTRQLTFH